MNKEDIVEADITFAQSGDRYLKGLRGRVYANRHCEIFVHWEDGRMTVHDNHNFLKLVSTKESKMKVGTVVEATITFQAGVSRIKEGERGKVEVIENDVFNVKWNNGMKSSHAMPSRLLRVVDDSATVSSCVGCKKWADQFQQLTNDFIKRGEQLKERELMITTLSQEVSRLRGQETARELMADQQDEE